MARKSFDADIEIRYVPCPPEKAEEWRAGMRLLLQLLYEADLAAKANTSLHEKETSEEQQ